MRIYLMVFQSFYLTSSICRIIKVARFNQRQTCEDGDEMPSILRRFASEKKNSHDAQHMTV